MSARQSINQLLAAIDDLHIAASDAALDYKFQPSKDNPATRANCDRLTAAVATVGECVTTVRSHLAMHPNRHDADTFARAMRRLEGLYRMHEDTFIDHTIH